MSCTKSSYVPEDLTPVFHYLDTHLSPADVSAIKNYSEKGFPPYYHESKIQDRIDSLLKTPKKEWINVKHFFDSLAVRRPKDQSGILINMYHDYLNLVDISIDKELIEVINYWEPIETCHQDLKYKSKFYQTAFKKNDHIIIQMPVDEHDNAIDYSCPNLDWSFKKEHDLTLEGIITKSYFDSVLNQSVLNVKISKKSNEYTMILSEEIFIGDVINIPTETSWNLKPKS
ncbi:hypothetical protein [Psychroserpens sp. SPM9]|uniref:hypothetical protein n=1 Tax=Psychroserpens sp. SPM9 TaxID=2975598 RepID=UPI0021A61629|nr:hypothetical protein [Psychroserpens sp. SPM9]MDG5491389.1 hypothetical protein [Psychroserpens sp. SPM9]